MKTPQVQKEKIFGFVDKYFGYLSLFIIVVVVGLGTYYIVYPHWNEVQGVELLRVREKEGQLTEAESYLSDLKAMRDKYTQVDYFDVQRLSQVLPRDFDEEQMFLTLRQFGKESGLEVTNLKINTVTSQSQATEETARRRTTDETAESSESVGIGTIRQVDISLTVRGVDTYESFKQFLMIIETHAPLLDLGEVAWPIEGGQVIVDLVTYYLAEA